MRTEFLCISVSRVASGPRVKLASCKSALNPPVVRSTDRSKAVVPVLVLLFVALWFILRGDLLYVFPCVILFLCFSVLLVLRLPRLGKRDNPSAFRTFVRFVLVYICWFLLPLGVWEGLRFVIVALPGLFSYLFYSTDLSKAVVLVLVLLFVALWFSLQGDLFYVLPCVILFLCFSVLLALRLPHRLGKRELILVLFVRLFDLCLFGFVGFLFLLVSRKGCRLWLWHSLDFSLTYFYKACVSANFHPGFSLHSYIL